MMEPVLPVEYKSIGLTKEELLAKIARGEPPDSAEEYLLRVRLEADELPEVTTATNLPPDAEDVAAGYVPAVEPVRGCPPALVPDESWEREVLAAFVELRQYLAYWAAQGVGSKEFGARIPVPYLKDELGWHIFHLGNSDIGYDTPPKPDTETTHDEGGGSDSETEKNEEKKGEKTEKTVEKTPSVTGSEEQPKPWGAEWTAVLCKQGMVGGGWPPTVSLLLQFDQVVIRKLLHHHAKWLRGRILSKARAAWIYALLARLSKPLDINSSALVRELLRRCCKIRAEIQDPEDGIASSCNLIITICGQFYGQRMDGELR